uniref:Uncharacterized protein n=1 Tax=Tetradesmus obliquus TaxID=3088 RepID=A0A383V7G3_TETOB
MDTQAVDWAQWMKDAKRAASSVELCQSVSQSCKELGPAAEQQPEKQRDLVNSLHSSMLSLAPFLQELAKLVQAKKNEDEPTGGRDARLVFESCSHLLRAGVNVYRELTSVLPLWRQHYAAQRDSVMGAACLEPEGAPGGSAAPSFQHQELLDAIAAANALLQP